jgi:hypothetical protein
MLPYVLYECENIGLLLSGKRINCSNLGTTRRLKKHFDARRDRAGQVSTRRKFIIF